FIFSRYHTIWGGNAVSALAGEFAFSISLSLALVFLGVLARSLETGGHRAPAALLLALTGMSHILPAMFAVAGAGVLLLLHRGGRHRFFLILSVGAVAAALAAFWLLPFALSLPYSNDMGWERTSEYLDNLLPFLRDDLAYAMTAHFRLVLPLAVLGAGLAFISRRRGPMTLAGTAAVAALVFRFLPEGPIWNARLLPFWYLCLYLLAAYAVAEFAWAAGNRFRSDSRRRAPGVAAGALVATAALVFVTVGGPLGLVPGMTTTDKSFVPDWARWNYSGYERKDAWPEYRTLVDTMSRVGGEHGCGRALWEYEQEQNRFGTPMALMLLPYWTDGCIASMEGLYFESSATVPYHFLAQSELSRSPSRAMRGLPYRELDVTRGVEHLQLLGVRYYLATTAEAQAQARTSPHLTLIETTPPVPAASGTTQVGWEIFLVDDSDLVVPLAFEPAVVDCCVSGREEWLETAVSWYQEPSRWGVPLAASGPADWPHIPDPTVSPPRRPVQEADVRDIRESNGRVSFRVDRPGSPVLVKVSHFPNWKASGAEGPWRVTPNFMVVVPTSTEVELRYGWTPVEVAGWLLTALGMAALVLLWRRPMRLPELPASKQEAVAPGTAEVAPAGALVAPAGALVGNLRWALERGRRFMVVGALVTVTDVALLLVLRLGAGFPLAVAGALAIAAAASLSYFLNWALTFADEPYVRWANQPARFAALVAAAGVVDIVVLLAGTAVLGDTAAPLLLAKLLAVATAGSVRLLGYRLILFRHIKRDQQERTRTQAPPGERRLTVVIPAYKESGRIGRTVERVREALSPVATDGELEIVVVDDGSADATADEARAAGADQVISHPANRGKGAAVRSGMLVARGRTIAYTDADLSYAPEQILGLLKEIEGGWDVAVGSRRHVQAATLARARRLRELTGRAFNLLTYSVLLGQYRDTQCGLKAFRSDVARVLFGNARVDGFAFDVELLHLAERYRLSLTEVPAKVTNSQSSTVHVVVDSARMLRDLFRIRRWAGQGLYDLNREQRVLLRTGPERPLPSPVGWLRTRLSPVLEPLQRVEARIMALPLTGGGIRYPMMTAGVIAAVLALWLARGAWGSGLPAGDDTIGHLVRGEFAISQLLARGRLDGWFPQFALGHEMFLSEGPGFAWLLALLRGSTLGVLSTAGAMKVVAVGSLAALPLAAAYLARSAGLTRRAAGVAGVLALAVSTPFGTGLEGIFGTGLIHHQIGAVLFLLALGATLRLVAQRSRALLALAAGLIALLVVTDPISAVVLAVTLPPAVAAKAAAFHALPPWLGRVALAGVGGLVLAAFWLLPLLAHRDLLGPLATWGTPPLAERLSAVLNGELLLRPPLGLFAALGWVAALLAAVWGWRPGWFVAGVPAVYLVLAHQLAASPGAGRITLQLANRGLAYMGIIILFALAAGVARAFRPLGDVGYGAALLIAAALVLVSLRPLTGLPSEAPEPVPEMAQAAQQLATLVPEGARFATERDFPQETDRTGVMRPDIWLAWKSGRNTLAEFNTEASASSAPGEIGELGKKAPEASADALARSGVTHVVTTSDALSEMLAASTRFDPVWDESPLAILEVRAARGQPPPSSLLSADGVSVEASVAEADPERLRIAYRAPAATRATVAISWSPKWRAAIDGRARALQPTADGMLSLELPAGRHTLALEFGPDGWDWAGRLLTLAGLLAAAALLWTRGRPPAPPSPAEA
ncbi:MAG TPA: glycosyltransferase, partial [Egibacteraceae bacterium]|nr:glycosyltransferase [Egibacteraceae bacterium]